MEYMVKVLCVFLATIGSTIAKFNFTYKMATLCKEHISRRGYEYDTFYRVNREGQNLEPGVDFEMHMAILAPSNGHVLLSPVANPTAADPVYEIVIGGGLNRFSEIRRNTGRNGKASSNTVNILSAIEFRAFCIRVEDGTLELFEENQTLPVLSYHDTNPLTINYFSFSTWTGVEAKFLYDCPKPGDNVTIAAPDSTVVERNLTSEERLRAVLMASKSVYEPPGQDVVINTNIYIEYVKYNVHESKLDVVIIMALRWIDTTYSWNATMNDGTIYVNFHENEIWRPVFFIYNADKLSPIQSSGDQTVMVFSSGDLITRVVGKASVWCDDRSSALNNWPRDEYKCKILIGPWAMHEQLNIKFDENMVNHLMKSEKRIETDWEILSTECNIKKQNSSKNHEVTNIEITLNIKRRGIPYNIVLYTPLLVVVTYFLLSFWTEPLVISRIWYYAGCSAILCTGLSYMDYLVPTHTLPSILILYNFVLLGSVFTMLINAILMHPSMSRVYQSNGMCVFLSNNILRCLFGLTKQKPVTKSTGYEVMNEDIRNDGEDSGISTIPRNNLEEMQADDKVIGEREEFAEVVDKILFTFYSIVFAILLALHY